MTQQVAQGGNAVLDAQFRTSTLQLVDAPPVQVDIIDPNDMEVVSNAAPTSHPATGLYSYTYAVPEDAELGVWQIRWAGVINDVAVQGLESFIVVEAGEIVFGGDTFATIPELANYLGVEIELDDERARRVLLSATAIIQAEACHRIFFYADDEKKLRGCWGSELQLPEPPVEEVSAVSVGDAPLTSGTYQVTRWGALKSGPTWLDEEPYWLWAGPNVEVTVVYSHGYAEVPQDIKAVCLSLASRLFENPSGTTVSESIGSYSYSNGSSSPAGAALTEDERRICRRYRPR